MPEDRALPMDQSAAGAVVSGQFDESSESGSETTGPAAAVTESVRERRLRELQLQVTHRCVQHACHDTRAVTKFAFEFDDVRTSNVFCRFAIHRIFFRSYRRIRISGLYDRNRMFTPTGHGNKLTNAHCLIV